MRFDILIIFREIKLTFIVTYQKKMLDCQFGREHLFLFSLQTFRIRVLQLSSRHKVHIEGEEEDEGLELT